MRSLLRALVTVGVVLACTGCWPLPGQNADRTADNPYETGITSENVADLTELWSYVDDNGRGPGAPINELVVSQAGVHVTAAPSLPETGAIVGSCRLTTLDPATGQLEWRRSLLSEQPGRDCSDSEPLVQGGAGDPHVEDDHVSFGSSLVRPTGPGQASYEARSATFDIHTGEPVATPNMGIVEARRGDVVVGEVGHMDPLTQQPVLSARITSPEGQRDLAMPGSIQGSATLGTDKLYVTDEGRSATQPPCSDARRTCVRAYSLAEPRPGCGNPPDEVECPLWATAVSGEPRARPVIGDGGGTLYLGTADGYGSVVYAMDAPTGEFKWGQPVLAGINASPALAGGRLFVPTDTWMWVFDASTGQQLWIADTYSPLRVQPAVAGDVVFTGAQDGTLRAYDVDGCGGLGCDPLWSVATGSPITAAPVISGGRVYVGTADGRVVAYGLPAAT